jgi:hypothetical protein
VDILVNWRSLPVGASVFLPAINTDRLHKQLDKIAELLGYTFVKREVIDGGKWGIRVWRTL